MTDIELLRRVLNYDPETGAFTWRHTTSRRLKPGDPAGYVNAGGYLSIKVGKSQMKAHRIAWMYVHGVIPEGLIIDHANGIRTDNRISNLRLADKAENNWNNRRKHSVGVYFRDGKWRARISHRRRMKHLGVFATEAEARAVRDKAARELRGAFHSETK